MASARADFPLAVGPATIKAVGSGGIAALVILLRGNERAVSYQRAMTSILTVVAQREATSLTPALLNHIRNAVRGAPPVVLSPGEAADIPLSVPLDQTALSQAFAGKPIDAIVTKARGRRKALLIADMDSTIVTAETLDELAGFAGIGKKIAAITSRAMNGELDFKAALRERVAMLKGLKLDALEQTWQRVRLTSGAKELVATMREKGALTALVSGGFTFFSGRVAAELGFDLHRSNVLLDDGVALTGQVMEPILGRDAKLAALKELAAQRGVRLAATLAVGDGANDLDMLLAAGLGVAFHAKPIVAQEARAKVDHAGLRALLFAQGYPASAFVGG
jgi:phosphoserine phosphatase